MQTTKGRILEIHENSVIVLTAQGEFIERPLPKGDVQVGDEITVTRARESAPRLSSLVSAASAAAVIGFLLLQSIGASASPAYYVHVDIEPGTPSVELAVSKTMRVVEATPLNDEGEKILSKASLNKKSVRMAMQNLVNTADHLKYIAPNKDNTLLISVAGTKNAEKSKQQQVCREVATAVKHQLKVGKTSATLGVATVDANARRQALNKKSSINSLLMNKHSEVKKQSDKNKKIPEEYEVSKVVPVPDKKSNKFEEGKGQNGYYYGNKGNYENNGDHASNKYDKYDKNGKDDKSDNNNKNDKNEKNYNIGPSGKSHSSKFTYEVEEQSLSIPQKKNAKEKSNRGTMSRALSRSEALYRAKVFSESNGSSTSKELLRSNELSRSKQIAKSRLQSEYKKQSGNQKRYQDQQSSTRNRINKRNPIYSWFDGR